MTPEKIHINRTLYAIAERYTEALKRSLGERLVSVVLFGSVARGEATEGSDIDLLIVAEGLPRSRLERGRVLAEADDAVEEDLRQLWQEGFCADVVPLLKTPDEARRIVPLYLDLTEDAVLLFDRDEFFAQILDRLREALKKLGAKRRRSGKILYWDLKPDLQPGEVFVL